LGRDVRVNLNQPKEARATSDRGGRAARGGRGGGRGGSVSEKPEGCTTVFLGNLSFDIDDTNVHDTFGSCGTIEKIRWVEKEGRFAGFGFIQFAESDATDKAVALNGNDLLGRAMRVDYAADRRKRDD